MSTEQLEELGPIDYVVFERQSQQPDAGEIQPLLPELVVRGVVPILDIAFVAKDPDGSVSGVELGDLKQVAQPPPSSRVRRRGRGHQLIGETILPGLLRGVVRTAAIAGTATAVSNRVSRRQAERWQQQGSHPYGQPPPAQQEPPPEYAAPPPAAPPPDPSSSSSISRSSENRGYSPRRSSPPRRPGSSTPEPLTVTYRR